MYSHQLGPGIGSVIEDLELIVACATRDELRNRVIYLPLRRECCFLCWSFQGFARLRRRVLTMDQGMCGGR